MAIVRLEGLGQLKKIHLIGTRTRDLPACSIVPEPTTLPCAPPEACMQENCNLTCRRTCGPGSVKCPTTRIPRKEKCPGRD
jgi:hypothetical protein